MSRERPILFNADMVRAILDGRKTQTRRVVKHQPGKVSPAGRPLFYEHGDNGRRVMPKCPYGQPGDRLWVRETTEEDMIGSSSLARYSAGGGMVCSESGGYHEWWYSRRVCPSVHMPRWASRITLEVAGVRVERLQDISEEDAKAEGADPLDMAHNPSLSNAHRIDFGGIQSHKAGFRKLWESINRPGSWDANPWVWVIEFRRLP